VRRVDQIVEMCGLKPEQNKKIESLSKGYRQRVGLGQALLHDPKVLILDEPTSGLDPNQLAEIRSLIRDIGLNKTVLFSTHIMQEVEALCDRVIVINRGSIVADDSLSNIMQVRGGQETVIVEFDTAVDPGLFSAMPGVSSFLAHSPRSFELRTSDSKELRSTLLRFAADQNLSLASLRQGANSLESVFQELTR
jgi:ABC-2 type transport system ATP-binding protein